MPKQKVWEAVERLIEDASADDGEALRRILQHGTPQQKLEVLQKYELNFDDLVDAHKDLEKIIYKGSVPWWWW